MACADDRAMPNYLKIMQGVDVQPLRAVLVHNPQLFGRHGARACAPQSPHASMTDIWVRYNDISKFPDGDLTHFNDEHDPIWYPEYRAMPQIKPILFGLMAAVEGERLGGVLITKLAPGGEIKTHTDSGWHAGYYDKFYVPIQNEPGASFDFPDGSICATPGDVFWFRNDVPHGVVNASKADRIAMIVCIKTDRFKGLR